uniref:Uncharacterized protein n=1 Tax=Peronospora matthiolae TaxID=2874970 RepID=A0AAV1URE7_9STRA
MLKSAIPTHLCTNLKRTTQRGLSLTQFVQEKAQEARDFRKDEEAGRGEVMKLLQVEGSTGFGGAEIDDDHVVSSAEKVKTYGALKSFVEPFATPKGSKRNTSKGSKTSEGKSKFIRFFLDQSLMSWFCTRTLCGSSEFMDSQRGAARLRREAAEEDFDSIAP